jgi:hypothetical protein
MRTIEFLLMIILLSSNASSLRVPGEPQIPTQEIYEQVALKDLSPKGIEQVQKESPSSSYKDENEYDEDSSGSSDNNPETYKEPQMLSSDSVSIDRDKREVINENGSRKKYEIDVEIVCNNKINSLDINEILEKDLILIQRPIYAYKIGSFDDACSFILNDFNCSGGRSSNLYKNKYNFEYPYKKRLFKWEKAEDIRSGTSNNLYKYIKETLDLPWTDKENINIIKNDSTIFLYYNESILVNKKNVFCKHRNVGYLNNYHFFCNGKGYDLNVKNVINKKSPDVDAFLKILRDNLSIANAKKDLLDIAIKGDLICFNFTDYLIINRMKGGSVILTTRMGSKYDLIEVRQFDVDDKKYIWTQIFEPGPAFDIQLGSFRTGEIIKYSYTVETKNYGKQRVATVVELNNNNFIKKIDEINILDPSYALNISMDTKNSKIHTGDDMEIEYSIKQSRSNPTNIAIDFEEDGKYFVFKDKYKYSFPIEEVIRDNKITIDRKLSYLSGGEYTFPGIIVNGVKYDFKERKVDVEDLFPQIMQAYTVIVMILGIIFGNIYGSKSEEVIRNNLFAITMIIIFLFGAVYYAVILIL